MPALWIAAVLAALLGGGGGAFYFLYPHADKQVETSEPPPTPPPPPLDLTPPPAPKPPEPEPAPAPRPTPARLDLSPSHLDFTVLLDERGQLVGTADDGKVELRNTGGEPLAIEELLTTGVGAFGIAGNCRERKLTPKQSCVIIVQFRPATTGSFSADLVIDHSAGPNERVHLSGLAQLASTPAPPDDAALIARLRAERDAAVKAAARTEGQLVGNALLPQPPQPSSTATQTPGSPSQAGYGTLVASSTSSFPVDRTRILTRDQVIPAVLNTSINSRIPGPVLAVVERPVWSSGAGPDRRILLEKGTSLIGRQVATTQRGDGRLAVEFTEMIRPDGARIVVRGDGADAMGRIGLVGDVDDRVLERYGGAILISLIGTGQDVLVNRLDNGDSNSSNSNSTVVIAGQQSSSDLGSIAQSYVNETLNLPPVINVPQGSRINVLLSADIVFPAPSQQQSDGSAAAGAASGGVAQSRSSPARPSSPSSTSANPSSAATASGGTPVRTSPSIGTAPGPIVTPSPAPVTVTPRTQG